MADYRCFRLLKRVFAYDRPSVIEKIKKISHFKHLPRLIFTMVLLPLHHMKSFATFALGCGLVVLSPSGAQAETWIARCNNLQFNFDLAEDRLTVYAKSTEGLNAEGQRFAARSPMISALFQGKIFNKSADNVFSSIPVSNPRPGEAANNFSVYPRWGLTKSSNLVWFGVQNGPQKQTFKYCVSNPPIQVVR